jgi:hypothetical protein
MKKIILYAYAVLFISVTSVNAQLDLNKALNSATSNLKDGSSGLSTDDVVKGLKDALSIGTNNSSSSASKTDGFFKNPEIMIPFPEEAISVKNTVDKLGMKAQDDKFVETLNHGAEEATKNAAPVFLNAITNMSIEDGFKILKGADNAATMYLKSKTSDQLFAAFKPIVHNALLKVDVTKYWTPLITAYNKIPFSKKQNPDLDAYVTQKAIDGLFLLIADQEKKIRKDPAAQVTDILKKVFGGQ